MMIAKKMKIMHIRRNFLLCSVTLPVRNEEWSGKEKLPHRWLNDTPENSVGHSIGCII